MKKFLVLIATAIGAAAISKKVKEQKAENDLWQQATDTSTTGH